MIYFTIPMLISPEWFSPPPSLSLSLFFFFHSILDKSSFYRRWNIGTFTGTTDMIYSEERKRSYDEKIIMRYGTGWNGCTGFNLVNVTISFIPCIRCEGWSCNGTGIHNLVTREILERTGFFFFFHHRFFRWINATRCFSLNYRRNKFFPDIPSLTD